VPSSHTSQREGGKGGGDRSGTDDLLRPSRVKKNQDSEGEKRKGTNNLLLFLLMKEKKGEKGSDANGASDLFTFSERSQQKMLSKVFYFLGEEEKTIPYSSPARITFMKRQRDLRSGAKGRKEKKKRRLKSQSLKS